MIKNKKTGGLGLNKKAEIGSTLTWIVATIIILFIIIIYVVMVLWIAKPNNVYELLQNERKDLGFAFMKKFSVFLNNPLDNGQTIYDYVILAEKDKITDEMEDKFKKDVKNFFDLNANYWKSPTNRRLEIWIFDEASSEFKKYWHLYYNEENIIQDPESPVRIYNHDRDFFISQKSKIYVRIGRLQLTR